MTSNNPTRRTVLRATGASMAVALVAGCNDNSGNGDDGDDDDGTGGGVNLDPGTDIRFSAQTTAWEGLEPSEIDGESNPTLILQEGEDYTIGWTEGDGSNHNIELRDENGEVVEDYETDLASEGGEEQIIEFTATSEIAVYRCEPHQQMEGEIQVE